MPEAAEREEAELIAAFLDASGLGEVPAPLAEQLAGAFREARAAWPEARVQPAGYGRLLAQKRRRVSDPQRVLEGLHTADLYGALACLEGDPAALRWLSGEGLREVSRIAARVDPSPAFADEVRQRMLELLVVQSPDQAPKLREYSGAGPLGAWLAAVALGTALNLQRASRPAAAPEPAAALESALGAEDLELTHLKGQHGEDFRRAFAESARELTSRERTILRLMALDGLTIDGVGQLFNVHRSTAARWAATAREKLHEGTRRRLADALRLPRHELDSLMRALTSQLEPNLRTFLGTE